MNTTPSGFTIRPAEPQWEASQDRTSEPVDTQDRQLYRTKRLAAFTMKIKTRAGPADLENEPAYRRRQVQLDDVQPSNASSLGRYTLKLELDDEGNAHANLSQNGFLSDQVD